MKRHAKHIAAGGLVAPSALAGAVAIANEIQTVLGLHLQGVGLALYLAAFILASSAVLHGQLRLEAQRILAELGSGELDLGPILGSLGGLLGPPGSGPGPEGVPGPAPAPSAIVPPPPPPPAP